MHLVSEVRPNQKSKTLELKGADRVKHYFRAGLRISLHLWVFLRISYLRVELAFAMAVACFQKVVKGCLKALAVEVA